MHELQRTLFMGLHGLLRNTLPQEIVVTLTGGPHDGFQIVWPGQPLMRFGEACYMVGGTPVVGEPPTDMVYIGQSKPYTLPAEKVESNAG
jgi:hypothetical protein